MGLAKLQWFPRDSPANLKTVDFDTPKVYVRECNGYLDVDRVTSITSGGKAYTQVFDAWMDRELVLRGFGPDKNRAFFQSLTSWWEHASTGGQFAFSLDSAKMASTTLNGAVAHNATVIVVTSTTGFANGDMVFFEHAADPTKHATRTINTVDSGTQVTLYEEIGRAFVTASIMRHADYWPAMICLDDRSPILPRKAGEGGNLWDLRAHIRSVR